MQLTALDLKANAEFPGMIVRKDLVGRVRGNAVVPGYVLEFLLAQYCATDNEATIDAGIESVRNILAQHYVHRGEAELVKSTIRDRGRHRVIDKVSVVLDDRKDIHAAAFSNLGLKSVPIDDRTVKQHPKLLTGGVWCMVDVEYSPGDAHEDRWIIAGLKPIQLGQFDDSRYIAARRKFSTSEWIDLLLQTIGFNPEVLSARAKLLQIVRLIPFVERNYNLVELGPKGTGKSHVYSEFSPHGMLISGGEVTVPKLFVNNSNGRIGLVGYWDVVAFDEFAGQKRVDKSLVDIMKNYMANKTFSRGVETIGAEASMAFIGNTSRPVPTMLAHSDLFDALPEAYHDSAYLDRLHCYLPGWEVEIIRRELFTNGFGFVVDYLAEALAYMRQQDFSDAYSKNFSLSEEISTRDRDGVRKTFSGLMKLIHPHGEATDVEIEQLLAFSIEGRKRVKDQILRIDRTMDAVRFGYTDSSGKWHDVTTQEEQDYPHLYHRSEAPSGVEQGGVHQSPNAPTMPAAKSSSNLRTGALDIVENALGHSYESLFSSHLRGANRIEIIDPYIRAPHQLRNLWELLVEVINAKPVDEIVAVHVVTAEEKSREDWQRAQLIGLSEIKDAVSEGGIEFTCEFDSAKHDRRITTDTGWRIHLGRGLDIFQPYTTASRFDLRQRLQGRRRTKECTITYLKV
ncbi:BREX system Lon protease-like protein BrxL [Rhodococcus sp. BP-252]|nr:BREX system Lon protease-like protein BrxL [Rhodococcus sp. BP-320]MBY6419050.1 BREX system Lon protease-like protein BrxL [Rhodococcus sp. BP-321]MBY6423764.1 BREX system Lon protease-like protein BrxL [Rhodococcus sp. BP-324]MBY6429084.1 BREX system Lon protease-like protein BrxL [Rhodococcus sp. BP-323]MBY6434090.1 BREX system Lon protease-like protein BrxL [Rhodococcus sp. BP-322]MBY6443023.1 BREX system Lon protease-like protein BrxL [Rhodococcus sp. BP-319]MBY6447838.1 BREX system Lo